MICNPLFGLKQTGPDRSRSNRSPNQRRWKARCKRKKTAKPQAPYLIGEMNSNLVAAEGQLNDMLRIANNYDSNRSIETAMTSSHARPT